MAQCSNSVRGIKQISKNIFIVEKVISSEMKNFLLEGLSEVEKLSALLKEYDISFCILGGRALPFYSYQRFTEDVDVLVAEEDQKKLAKIPSGVLSDHSKLKPFRVWIMSHFPDKKKTKVDMLFSKDAVGGNIKFDDPKKVSHEINGIPVINLYDLIRYKITSGIYGARSKDFGDVEELIKANKLPASFMDKEKVSFMRKKYRELHKNAMIQKESFDRDYEI